MTTNRYSQDFKAETHWLDPINRTIFQAAFKAQTPQVTLRDGRTFNLTYFDYQVKVRPTRGLVPMGTFSLKTVLDSQWIEEKES